MKRLGKPFQALWISQIVSEFGGAAGGIINGLLLYELTGSKEWMATIWLVYFIPSLVLQSVSAPFLNYVRKEKVLRNIQLLRAVAYLLPLAGYFLDSAISIMVGLVLLQCILGILQPIYSSLTFSIVPDMCKEEDLAEANGLLDTTLRLMTILAPGVTSLLLLAVPMHYIYVISAIMFCLSFLSLRRIPVKRVKKIEVWTRRFWWEELKEGYIIFFRFPQLLRLTILSSTVQFAVGATMVLSIPFIQGELGGEPWEFAVFKGAFPIGYIIGMFLLTRLPKTSSSMYIGLFGGGLSFILLFFAPSIWLAWIFELIGGILFPLFNAQSAAIFQREAPRDRLTQLSAVRLFLFRVSMPLGILFASSTFLEISTRQTYLIIGLTILLPAIFYWLKTRNLGEEIGLGNKHV